MRKSAPFWRAIMKCLHEVVVCTVCAAGGRSEGWQEAAADVSGRASEPMKPNYLYSKQISYVFKKERKGVDVHLDTKRIADNGLAIRFMPQRHRNAPSLQLSRERVEEQNKSSSWQRRVPRGQIEPERLDGAAQ
jgi:hypothetical protein